MSFGYAPVAPLVQDHKDGFKLTKTFQQNAVQNLKMFILTSPGERVMLPGFGLGIRRELFENDTADVREDIKIRILEGVAEYLPYIQIFSINIVGTDDERAEHTISLQINFGTTVRERSRPQKLNIEI